MRAHHAQQLKGAIDILNIGHLAQDGFALFDHDSRGDHRQDGILGALHMDLALQRLPTIDAKCGVGHVCCVLLDICLCLIA